MFLNFLLLFVFMLMMKHEVFTSSVQGRGIDEKIRGSDVVEEWDITSLKLGEAIIGLPGKKRFYSNLRERKYLNNGGVLLCNVQNVENK